MKGKGYKPDAKKKEAQTPYGEQWQTENVVEIANDALEEMEDPGVAQIVNSLVGGDVAPGSVDQASALVQALQADPRAMRKLQDAVYKAIMAEEPVAQPAQEPQVSEQYTMPQGEMMPALAAKGKGKSKETVFNPQVNEQQKPQMPIKPGDGLKVIKAFAVPADHPLVDDDKNRFPLAKESHLKLAERAVNRLASAPNWWLGSLGELKNTVMAAIKEAKIPPEFEKNIKKKKDKDGKDGKDKEDGGNPFAKDSSLELSFEDKCANMGLIKEDVESVVLDGDVCKRGSYSIEVVSNEGNEIVRIASEKGRREYPLVNIDSAVSDFIYLAATGKHDDPPPPMFDIRDGIRLACPGCGTMNSYPMPKEASDLGCAKCNVLIPLQAVQAAFDGGVAKEETTLIAFTPESMQEEFGEKFAKAAEMLGADTLGADGPIAEAYAVSIPNEKIADIWDFMVESGFKPLAQSMSVPAPAGDTPMITAQDDLPMLPPTAPEPPEEGMGDEMPPPIDGDVPDIGEPGGDMGYADNQMIQAAMMHYQAQGNSVTEAITQFTKDYGDGFDPETVMQVAATVFGIGLDKVKVAMIKEAGDLPSTSVNTQQPDAVSTDKNLGPDSETQGEIPTEKGKPQVSPQGTFADTSTEPDTDNKDPGDFGAGKPKVQHPATDQQGVKLPGDTNLGPDSETQMGGMMKDMESRSKAAPQSMQSK
jgi:hypothetical protein